VQTQLGHKDPALTLRVYQHLFPDDLDLLAARIDEAFNEPDVQDIQQVARPDRGLTIVRDADGETGDATTRDFVAPPAGFEPATHGLGNRRSIL
jgi:hypothetical protein